MRVIEGDITRNYSTQLCLFLLRSHTKKWPNCRQFGIGAEVSYGHFGTGTELSHEHFGTSAKLSGHFGPVSMVPKCFRSEVSRVRSVYIQNVPVFEANAPVCQNVRSQNVPMIMN